MTRDEALKRINDTGVWKQYEVTQFVDALVALGLFKVDEPLKDMAHELARQALVGGGCSFTEACMHIHNMEASGLAIVRKEDVK